MGKGAVITGSTPMIVGADLDQIVERSSNRNLITYAPENINSEIDPSFVAWDKSTGISITQFQVTDGITTFASMLTSIGATNTTIIVDSPIAIIADATVDANISLDIRGTGLFTISAGKVLTINGSFTAGLRQVFAGTGTVVFGVNTIKEVYPQWWGALADGITDDAIPLQSALTAYTNVKLVKGTYYTTVTLYPIDNQIISGEGPCSVISITDGTIHGIYINSKDDVTIRDLAIATKTQANATTSKGGILVYSATRCLIYNITISDLAWAGIWLWDSTYCTIRDCKFYTWFDTLQDSSDIMIYNNSNYNLIEGNHCYGGGDHGIIIQDPYTSSTPTGNIINNNLVGEHNAYGIAVYVCNIYDTKTVVTNNNVHDILGTALAGTSGSGIYIESAGGTIIANNQVSNCCRSTSNPSTLGIAHITIKTGNRITYAIGEFIDIICTNNHINAPKGRGICAAASDASALIKGNTIYSNGSAVNYEEAIYVSNCQNVKVISNIIQYLNTNLNAISCLATTTNYSNIHVIDNLITTVAYGISITAATGGSWENLICRGNNVSGGDNTALYLQDISIALISGNYLSSSATAFYLNGVLNARISNNDIISSGSPAANIIFSGTNTGSIVDESNYLSGIVNNVDGNGTLISIYANAAPAMSGTWCISDRVIQSVTALASPKAWRCTVAGNPGTWVSEGNL